MVLTRANQLWVVYSKYVAPPVPFSAQFSLITALDWFDYFGFLALLGPLLYLLFSSGCWSQQRGRFKASFRVGSHLWKFEGNGRWFCTQLILDCKIIIRILFPFLTNQKHRDLICEKLWHIIWDIDLISFSLGFDDGITGICNWSLCWKACIVLQIGASSC